MEIIDTKNIQYNDTPQLRLFASQNFNWCLDKEAGITATWGKTPKQTPQYDPISPQEIVWKIQNFKLKKFIEYFNFLANIRLRKDNTILPVENINDCLENSNNYICMSTLSNIIFILDSIPREFNKFINYIRSFNITINIQIEISSNINLNKIYQLTPSIILSVKPDFIANDIINKINQLQDKFLLNIKLHINENSNIQLLKFIQNIKQEICCIIYNEFPYLSTRKYLNFQSRCISFNKQNICLAQCSKKYYSKDVIGSLILELPCSFCKYSIYLEDNKVYNCEVMKKEIGLLENYKTLDLLWNDLGILDIRKQLIDNNKCDGIK